jgi:DNA-binding MarR family transcriptional regulator
MDANQTADMFADLYTSIYRHTYRRRDPRETRVSGETLAMLQHLRDSGPLTVTEAASHFDRSQAAISERIERLIERGLVTRVSDERDRRRHLIWLSEAGEELLSLEREVLSSELLLRATKRMSVADREALIEGLRAFIAASVAAARELRKET